MSGDIKSGRSSQCRACGDKVGGVKGRCDPNAAPPVCKKHNIQKVKILDSSRASGFRWDCRACTAERRKKCRLNNPDRHNELRRAGYKKNPAPKRLQCKRHRTKHGDKVRAYDRARYDSAENCAYQKKYRAENPDKVAASTATKRAREKNAQVDLSQLDKAIVRLIYEHRKKKGRDWEVDHIVPLALGGTHEPANLRVITRAKNQLKKAKPPSAKELRDGVRRYFLYRQVLLWRTPQ